MTRRKGAPGTGDDDERRQRRATKRVIKEEEEEEEEEEKEEGGGDGTGRDDRETSTRAFVTRSDDMLHGTSPNRNKTPLFTRRETKNAQNLSTLFLLLLLLSSSCTHDNKNINNI